MARRGPRLSGFALVAIFLCHVAPVSSGSTQGSEPPASMSEDVQRMHERLLALSRGEGSISSLRIELMHGGMAAHRSFNIEGGRLVSKEWTSPGSRMIQREGTVTESRVSKLLQDLITKEYWTFPGTRFVPDAPIFLFRFYYGDLDPVDFRCDDDELAGSEERIAIRDTFLRFVAATEMKTVPAKE